jgi:hypothetical protein
LSLRVERYTPTPIGSAKRRVSITHDGAVRSAIRRRRRRPTRRATADSAGPADTDELRVLSR